MRAAAVLAAGGMVLAAAACSPGPTDELSMVPAGSTKLDASPITKFTYTGSVSDPFVVPAGVTSIHVDVSGGSGGQAVTACTIGLGARVAGDLAVQPGDSIVVAVGGKGAAANKNKNPGSGGWSSPAAYAGGGGGRAHGALDGDGDGGGGATTISVNGAVVAVAAGGGGGGGMSIATCYGGGNGGTDTGGSNGQGSKLAGAGGSASSPSNDKTGRDSSTKQLQSGGGGGGGGHFVGGGGQAGVDGGGGGGGSSLSTALTNAGIVAAAAGDGNATLTFTGTVAPTISGTPPAGRVGTPYSFGFSTTGSPAPTVDQRQGDLPDGLSIDEHGVITGTPNTAGTFDFTVTASNAKGDTDPLKARIVIDEAGAVGASVANPQTFAYSGAIETVIVPVGVTSAQVVLDGAAGGGAGGSASNQPGRGAEVTGTLPVTPGDTLEIGIGGKGQPNDGNQSPGAGGWGAAPKYSGGNGGSGHGAFDSDASGGGGATTLAINGTVQVVAAGAGGASSSTLGQTGWAGGSGGGEDGGHAGSSSVSSSGGGKGGAPGTSFENDRDGRSGSNPSAGGGGGGGGHFPGQGGRSSALGEGGGGGGSLTDNLTDARTVPGSGGDGSGKITWLGAAPTLVGQPPAATAGTPLSFTFTTTGSPIVTVTRGTLPAGLSLSRSGRLTGTPTAAGTSALTLTATNYFGSAPLDVTIAVGDKAASAPR